MADKMNHLNLVDDELYSKEALSQEQLNYITQHQSSPKNKKDPSHAVQISNYEIKKKIGSGNFAVVKLAEHIPTKAKVAIKIIDKRKMSRDNMKKIWREIEIMKKIENHKNIIKLYQVLQNDNYLFLVTDYCEGGELFDYLIANGRLKENQARFLFKQILDAIEYLHQNVSIVHRDLKAENLLLSEDRKTIKVADFGFSNYYKQGELLNTFCGSLPYASPELFQGKEYNGQKADIWSLGVVLYALVCGALPFGGNSVLHDLKNSILSGTFRIPFWLSEDCEELIRNMLVVEPEKRFSIKQIRQHKWMKQLNEESNDSYEISQTIGGLDKLNINYSESINDKNLIEDVQKLATRFSNVKIDECIKSIKNKNFDDYYALYHLSKDYYGAQHSSATVNLQSSPLLPVIAAGQHRKSSITTGVVERENSDQTIYDQSSHLDANLLNAVINTQRRHTFGPESSSTTNLNLPALFLTPPNAGPNIALNSFDTHNLICPSNIPMPNMDLLKPPEVFTMVNNNMLRRASDGQANYFPNEHFNNLNRMDSDENDYSLNGSNSELDIQPNPQHLSPHHNNSLYELNNNQYRYSMNDQQTSVASTPSPPLQFQSSINPFYQQFQQSPTSPYHSFNSSLQQRSSPYSSGNLNLKDKSNYLNRKRHSLTETFDLNSRRKVHNAAVSGTNNLNNQATSNNLNGLNNANFTNQPSSQPRRASEGLIGNGQLLQQLAQRNLLLSNGKNPYQLATHTVPGNQSNNLESNNKLNYLSNSSINQLKNCQPQQTVINQAANLQKLQISLRPICVSSPPSLHTSPTHPNPTQPQSPCQSLQMISEEQPNLSALDRSKLVDLYNDVNSLNHNFSNLNRQAVEYMGSTTNNSLPCSPIPPYSGFAITPPQFYKDRTPVNEECQMSDEVRHQLSLHIQQQIKLIQNQPQNHLNQFSMPSISITDEYGGDIIAAPKEFDTQGSYFEKNQLNRINKWNQYKRINNRFMNSNQQPNYTLMQHDQYPDHYGEMNDDDQLSSNYQHIWREEDKLVQEPFDTSDYWYSRENMTDKLEEESTCLAPNLLELKNSSQFNQCCTLLSSLVKKNDNVLQQVHNINRSEEDDQFEHLDQEFDEADEEVRTLLHSTDSGSILISDVDAAKKLLLKFHQFQEANDDSLMYEHQLDGNQKLLFEENDICIEAEYNELNKRLILRRVSGEMNKYTSLCQQLINNII